MEQKIEQLKFLLQQAQTVLIGAGSGLSTAAGHTYTGARFYDNFADFHAKYGIPDLYSGGFYPFETVQEKWAWWSCAVMLNRYAEPDSTVHRDLCQLLQGKDFFVLTTNVDHLFQQNGFKTAQMFYTQGDYGSFQCSRACHDEVYDNQQQIERMVHAQQDMKIPMALVPICPKCGAEMDMHLRKDDTFVQNAQWYAACERYDQFVQSCADKAVVYLELGVGQNTPAIIKHNFWRQTYRNPHATYVCINQGEAYAPDEIAARSLCIDGDIAAVLHACL